MLAGSRALVGSCRVAVSAEIASHWLKPEVEIDLTSCTIDCSPYVRNITALSLQNIIYDRYIIQ